MGCFPYFFEIGNNLQTFSPTDSQPPSQGGAAFFLYMTPRRGDGHVPFSRRMEACGDVAVPTALGKPDVASAGLFQYFAASGLRPFTRRPAPEGLGRRTYRPGGGG